LLLLLFTKAPATTAHEINYQLHSGPSGQNLFTVMKITELPNLPDYILFSFQLPDVKMDGIAGFLVKPVTYHTLSAALEQFGWPIKNVLIIGASKGLGEQTALIIAEQAGCAGCFCCQAERGSFDRGPEPHRRRNRDASPFLQSWRSSRNIKNCETNPI